MNKEIAGFQVELSADGYVNDSGQWNREIAAALARRASAFLLDEPLSGLDPAAANEFTEVLADLRRDGAAILLATHDIFRAMELGTTIGIMKSGELVERLDPGSVTGAELEKIYLESMRGGAAGAGGGPA